VSPLLPAASFVPAADRCSGARPRFLRSDRSPSLDAAFHSPAATPDLSVCPRSQVNAPGLHLRNDF